MSDLTFAEVSKANYERACRWHPGFPADEDWNLADWSNAMSGEVGEVAEALLDLLARLTAASGKAGNVVKKIRRHEGGLRGYHDPEIDKLRAMLAEELADVYLYLDLLAAKAAVDLPEAIVTKFNQVSERQEFPDRLDR